jgi:hypothetical protein
MGTNMNTTRSSGRLNARMAACMISAVVTVLLLAQPVELVAHADTASTISWPQRRFAPCGAFDSARSTMYVFGGRAEGGQSHYADAWALDAASTSRPEWRALAAADAPGAPPPTRSCAAAYDPVGDRLIVFSGWNGSVMQNGVWALTFGGATVGRWTQICDATSCGAPPTARRASQMVYDAARKRMIVFGGLDGSYRNDLWSLDLNGTPTWTAIAATGELPLSRGGHSMVADVGRDGVWLFGGTRTGSDLGDVWWLDLAANEWRRLDTACGIACPSPRSGATVVHDTTADRLVLYGGWESGPDVYPEQAWTLNLTDAPTWRHVDLDSERPQPRSFHLAGYDQAAQRMIVFGGGSGSSAYKDSHTLHLPPDRPAYWRGVQPTTPITARDQVAVTFDAESRRLTAFGGFGSGAFPGAPDAGAHLADTFQLRLGAGGRLQQWRNATPTDAATVPIAREATSYATDTANHRLYLVGGLTGDIELNDVWVVDSANTPRPQWRQLCSPSSCGEAPPKRWGGHAIHDADGERLIVFGGRGAGGVALADTWVLDLSPTPAWSRLQTTGVAPPARWGGAVSYDPASQQMVVFGGQTGPDSTGSTLDDTWALSLAGQPTWRQLDDGGVAPSARRSPAYADSAATDLLLSGGLSTETGAHHNDVWALHVSGDRAVWTQLATDSCADPDTPMCRRSASAVFDEARNELVVVFGRDSERFFDDLWRFKLDTRSWHTSADTCAARAGS